MRAKKNHQAAQRAVEQAAISARRPRLSRYPRRAYRPRKLAATTRRLASAIAARRENGKMPTFMGSVANRGDVRLAQRQASATARGTQTRSESLARHAGTRVARRPRRK